MDEYFWKKERDRTRKRKEREAQRDEQREFDNLEKKHHMRNIRSKQNGSERLLQNLEAKKGIEEGRFKTFAPSSHALDQD